MGNLIKQTNKQTITHHDVRLNGHVRFPSSNKNNKFRFQINQIYMGERGVNERRRGRERGVKGGGIR